jgi:hypothetical protein
VCTPQARARAGFRASHAVHRDLVSQRFTFVRVFARAVVIDIAA